MALSLHSYLFIICLLCLIALPFAVPGILEVLLALAIGSVISGVLIMAGLVPSTLTAALLSVALLSLLAAAILWKPLRKLQKTGTKVKEDNAISDFVGLTLHLEADTSKTEPSTLHYSGVAWKVWLDANSSVDQLDKGAAVVVSHAGVGVLHVLPAHMATH